MGGYSYMIGSGWWCTDQGRVPGRPYHGSDLIRGAEFHHLWSAIIDEWTAAESVLIVDSASPRKPPLTNPKYQMLTLAKNPGHSTGHTGHYSGWTASVIFSLEYALAADVDYMVYVEQDVLLHGSGIIEHCISQMRKPLMFGSGSGTHQPLQQSFFIVRKDGMRRFLAALHSIGQPDQVICPEFKFVMASVGAHGRWIELLCADQRWRGRLYRLLGRLIESLGYDFLPIGYGRARPLHPQAEYYYFQQGSLLEVQQFLGRLPDSIFHAVMARAPLLRSIAAERPSFAIAGRSEG